MARGRGTGTIQTPAVRASARQRPTRISNPWTRRSIERATAPGYLDALSEIYPLSDDAGDREIPDDVWAKVVEASSQDDATFFRALTGSRIPRWPGRDNRFIAMFAANHDLILLNPGALSDAMRDVRAMDLEELRIAATAPISASRQNGPYFRSWLAQQIPTASDIATFEGSRHPVVGLNRGDERLNRYASEKLGYRGDKGLDAIVRVGDTFLIVEAKFITASGGNQTLQAADALSVGKIHDVGRKVYGAAVMDGFCLLENGQRAHQMIRRSRGPVLSALLFTDFLEHLAAGGSPRSLPAPPP
ncbi:hypothetical protein [Miltoncostaea oceani]|uniref:hypothetical protein n=1 Tax=Miltoncostaea oceani TaxID=2843216 RepID=UPI001C3D125E|nr:hypothetical protein [Miltoncostaea oceani]